ncbi:MAG: hypothetical protein JWM11_5106 [Planctomycetaceae bacterium]|nr:hypothetical protein [Planctomycetaceae bacterium]
MNLEHLIYSLVRLFERLGVPYFITGSVAAMTYGESRFTNDVDILADLREEHVDAFYAAFPPPDYYLSAEAVRTAILSRRQFKLLHITEGVKAVIIISRHSEFDQSRFDRRRPERVGSEGNAMLASPEDVIIKKLEYYREGQSEKHLRDIAGILQTCPYPIDHVYIEYWAASLKVLDIWQILLQRLQASEQDDIHAEDSFVFPCLPPGFSSEREDNRMSDRIAIVCPSCSGRFAVSDESKLGKKIRCPKCSEIFIASASKSSSSKPATKAVRKPSDDEEFDDGDEGPEDDFEAERKPLRKKSDGGKRKGKRRAGRGSSNTQIPLIIGGSIAAVALIAVGLFFAFRGKGEPLTGQNVQPQPGAASILGNDPGAATNAPIANSTNPGAPAEVSESAGKRSTEPFDVKAFLATRTAAADNAAPDYLLALADLHSSMDYVHTPEEWQKRLPSVQALQKAIEQTADIDRLRSGAIPIADVEPVLVLARPTIDKFTQAQNKTNCVFDTDLHIGSIPPYILSVRSFGRMCIVELFAARQKGDFAAAHQTLKRALRLSRDLRPKGTLITQLTATALETLISSTICDLTLSQPGLTVENCDQLIELLTEHWRKRLDILQEAIRIEYILTQNTLIDIQSHRLSLAKLVQFVGNGQGALEITSQQLIQTNWDAERSACDEVYAAALRHANDSLRTLKTGWAKTKDGQNLPNPSNLLGLLTSTIKDGFIASWKEKTRLAAVIALVALRRYQLTHNGAAPPDLDTAILAARVSIFLRDGFNDGNLGFSVVNGKPVVYSVGFDLVDSGGKIDSGGDKKNGDIIFRIKE